MKKTTKVLLTLVCAILLVASSILGTIAYLTSTDTVTNTFTVGNVKITLDEAKVGTDGKALTGDDAERVKANTYKLLPGHEYDKDPTVTVKAGSDESYIKMVVTVNKAAELDKIFKTHNITDLNSVIEGYDSKEWTLEVNGKKDETANTRTYVFYYKSTVTAIGNGEEGADADVVLDDLFEKIKVPDGLTNAELDTLYYKYTYKEDGTVDTKTEDKLTITVNAYAIQADGFNSAEAAWAAYPAN